MLEIENAFQILPIKPEFDTGQVKNATKTILAKYHPDNTRNEKPKELKEILRSKYQDIFKAAHATSSKIKKGQMDYSHTIYNRYMATFKEEIKNFNKDRLIIILEANDLDTTGNREQLENKIVENIPSYVADLNYEEHNLREQYSPSIKDILGEFKENKLIRIAELKNIPLEGTESIISKIISNCSEDEIYDLINQVKREIEDLKNKLKTLRDDQLKLILDNNNCNSSGGKNLLINKIVEQLPISEIENNINKVRINKQKALKKLYSITGKDELLESYKQNLFDNHLEIKHGVQIRKKIISLINNYKIEEQNIEIKINELINKKSQEINNEILNELYEIVGKKSVNPKFLKKLKNAQLEEKDGIQIKNEIISDIKSWKVEKENLPYYINLKIKQLKLKKQNEKLDVLYNITGKTNLKSSFEKLLSEYNLNNQEGLQIKAQLADIIKKTNIEKNEIKPKLLELINLTALKKITNKCNKSHLDQISMINNLPKCNSKQKYEELFLEKNSQSFNYLKVKTDVEKINHLEKRLNKLYKLQLEFILKSNNINGNEFKNKMIAKIISNIPIEKIELNISKIDGINVKLNKLTLPEISFIITKNNIKITGTKNKIVNEINKKLPFDMIEKDIKKLNNIKFKLRTLNYNELKFIVKSNNINIDKNENQLIDLIEKNVPFNIISKNISEIQDINNIVKSFNKNQRQHLLRTNILSYEDDEKTQINKILENIDLFEIFNFNNELNKLKEELNNLNTIQLNYILNNNGLEIADNNSDKIKTILENILMPLIKKDVKLIKKIENKLNTSSKDEIKQILVDNKLKKSINKEENIETILENLTFDDLNIYLFNNEPKNNNAELSEELEKRTLICPIKISNGKKVIITEKHKNYRYILLFDDEKSFNSYQKNHDSIDKIENNLNYFKKIVDENRKIDGIKIKKPSNDLIIKN